MNYSVRMLLRLVFAMAGMLLCAVPTCALEVRISAKADGDKPRVSGTTNLSDGTELLITIDRADIKFMAQDKVVVRAGGFSTKELSDKGRGLLPGRYSIDVTMPVAAVQSADVRKVIGARGERLTGAVVKKSIIGDKIVEYKTTLRGQG
jgi:hypothetical protein